jgi:ubiquinol-cytochrome c reductase cytochrome b subunit
MKPIQQLRRWLEERLTPSVATHVAPGGPSFAYVLGSVLVFLLGLLSITGVALSFSYSPSASDAWASVAYIEDQVSLGWFVRGLHHHGASALVIVTGLHLAQAAWVGAYRRPRELTWLLGIALLLLVLAAAITGYVLRWDQAGYWASKVEVGIAAATPLLGDAIQRVVQGGNDYGNLTVTRFHALHVGLVPAIATALVLAHVWLSRRHGVTPRKPKNHEGAAKPWWPYQSFRNMVAISLVFSALVAYVISTGGAGLDAPADPTAAYEARPLWYFRWLFLLRKLFGSFETVAALLVPGLVLGFLAAMPWIDRGDTATPTRATMGRRVALTGFLSICVAIALLTGLSLRKDAVDAEFAEHAAQSAKLAAKARHLAKTYGVPPAGGLSVFETVPMWKGRTLWNAQCASCHQGKDRKGPLIEAGYGNRAWIGKFFADPGGDEFFGRHKIATSENAMKPVELVGDELAAMIELVYAESGAADADLSRAKLADKLFEDSCADCHSREEGVASSGPSLARRGTIDHLVTFIGNPKAPIHLGTYSEMPRFDKELSMSDREAIAIYLLWLRNATKADLSKLEPL